MHKIESVDSLFWSIDDRKMTLGVLRMIFEIFIENDISPEQFGIGLVKKIPNAVSIFGKAKLKLSYFKFINISNRYAFWLPTVLNYKISAMKSSDKSSG